MVAYIETSNAQLDAFVASNDSLQPNDEYEAPSDAPE
jgi:hypothetical protein